MWSVGCILAELYAGKPLFYGTDENSILEKVKCSYLGIILVTYINLIVIYMTQRFLSATVFTLCMSFFSFFLFFNFNFLWSYSTIYFAEKLDWLIESLLAALSAIFSYIIGTRFTDGRRYIYVHDELSNLVQVKHTSLEKVQQLLSINKVSKIRCSAFGKGFAILYFRLSNHDKICICEKIIPDHFIGPNFHNAISDIS